MNEAKICSACQKEIINGEMKVGNKYKPVYCVAERETIKKGENSISKTEDNFYHYRCYKEKKWDETDQLSEQLINLANKRY